MALPPAVDYTNKDYASLRKALLDLARYRLPEWTDHSSADLGILMLELFSYAGDIILYYQDRIASESFLHTATERRSVLHLLRLIGYSLKPAISSTADLTLTFEAPPPGGATVITVPSGAQFATKASNGKPAITFEYLGPDLKIDLKSSQVTPSADGKLLTYTHLPVRNSRSIGFEVAGSSTGEPNQSFALASSPLIPESLEVQVDEGAGFVSWNRRESLLYHVDDDGKVTMAGPDSRDYYVQIDENEVASIHFGDGVYGKKPPARTNNIRARYRVGNGAAGNVPATSITDIKTKVPQLKSVTNPNQAVGGADSESIDHAVEFGPLAFRSGQRAVTLNDFISLAHQVGGVAKVKAASRGWNRIDLYVAPDGSAFTPAPDDLKRRLVTYFEDKRMIGTIVTIRDPKAVSVDISVDVIVEHNFDPEAVRQQVSARIGDLLAFKNVDFDQPIYLSKVYEAVESINGVHAATVTRFRRQDHTGNLFEQLGVPVENIPQLPMAIQRTLRAEIATEGRVDLKDFELPQLGRLEVRVQEAER